MSSHIFTPCHVSAVVDPAGKMIGEILVDVEFHLRSPSLEAIAGKHAMWYLDKCTLEETLTFIDRYGPALALTMTIKDIHLPDEFVYKGYYISAQVMEGELLRTAQVKSL